MDCGKCNTSQHNQFVYAKSMLKIQIDHCFLLKKANFEEVLDEHAIKFKDSPYVATTMDGKC